MGSREDGNSTIIYNKTTSSLLNSFEDSFLVPAPSPFTEPRVVVYLHHNEYACEASEPFLMHLGFKSIISLEITVLMGLIPTSFWTEI